MSGEQKFHAQVTHQIKQPVAQTMVVDAQESTRQCRRLWVADGDPIGPCKGLRRGLWKFFEKLLSGISITLASADSWSTAMGVAPR